MFGFHYSNLFKIVIKCHLTNKLNLKMHLTLSSLLHSNLKIDFFFNLCISNILSFEFALNVIAILMIDIKYSINKNAKNE